MHKYEIRTIDAEGNAEVWQLRDDGIHRRVSDEHQAYRAWIDEGNKPEIIPYEPPPAPSLEDLKAAKTAEIAASRYAAEVGGIELDGVAVKTDRESQSMMTAAAVSAENDPEYTVWWKGTNGWFQIDSKMLLLIGKAVRSHVQACFDKERALSVAINAAETPDDVAAVSWEA